MMDKFNKSHIKKSAKEFLKDYPDLTYILEDLNDLDEDIYNLIDYLNGDNIENHTDLIATVFDNYVRFLNGFVDFYELATALNMLKKILIEIDFNKFDEKSKDFISNYLIAILQDLQNWKDNVFVEQNAIDVFYINASALNSCIQLEQYIKKL